jgi:hypothetical protein
MLSLPAIAGQAIDPFSQLMETAYIGRLGFDLPLHYSFLCVIMLTGSLSLITDLFNLCPDLAFLGPVELGSAGVSIMIFNNVSKLFNIPLLSVATSFVAEDIAKNATKDSISGIRLYPFLMY